MNAVLKSALPKRRAVSHWLERLGREIDLTETQLTEARQRYEAVGAWLSESAHPWLAGSSIFAHGSIALGTAVKPVGRDEFDADLMSHLLSASSHAEPAHAKAVVGNRLREHSVYAGMLEELPRCWRLNYAGAFHLDITPSAPHPHDDPPALVVPDKRMHCWMPSNPVGYRERFEARAALRPRFSSIGAQEFRADVAEFPIHLGPRGVLRRVIQFLKRHRDLEFQVAALQELRPISVIITTLAAWSYEAAVLSGVYESEFDLLLQVIEDMPRFIEVRREGGRVFYVIANETVAGENFAEKWNRDAGLPEAFYVWHAKVVAAIRALAEIEGNDTAAVHTSREFGTGVGERVLRGITHDTNAARERGRIAIAPGLGVTISAAGSTPVRPNTFFGRR